MRQALNSDRIRRADVAIQTHKMAERAVWMSRTGGSVTNLEDAGVPRDVAKMMKAAIAGGTTSGDMAALAELRAQSEALVSTFANVGYFDALRADAISGEFWAQYSAAIADPVAGQFIEGRGIRVTTAAFDSRVLREQMAAALIVYTKELLRFGTAVGVIELLMRRAIARATDALTTPQLIEGAPTVAASGLDSSAVLTDLRRALAAIPSGSDARFRVGVSPALAKRLALMPSSLGVRAFPEMTPTGGVLAGIPCSLSEALGADAIVTDASAIIATASEIDLETSEAGAVEMDTTPDQASNDGGSPQAPAATTMVSLWQSGAVALKIQRRFDWAPVRTVHTVRITGAGNQWGFESDGSSPEVLS